MSPQEFRHWVISITLIWFWAMVVGIWVRS